MVATRHSPSRGRHDRSTRGRPRRWVVLALAVFFAAAPSPGATQGLPGGSDGVLDPEHLVTTGRGVVLERPDVVWLPGAWVVVGASDAALAYAEELCRRGVPVDDARQLCSRERFADEGPPRRVHVPAFGIDRTEVTVGDWDRCLRAGRCPPARMPPADPRVTHPGHPVGGVRWREAQSYCYFVGGRLPSEAEWERAARGGDEERRFPWGRFYDPRRSNHGGLGGAEADGYRHAAPAGAFPDGASPHGLLDMAGNAWEWTRDRYDPDRRHVGPAVDPRGPPSGGLRAVRGGSWRSDPAALRVTARQPVPEDEAAVDLGFRCAYDPPATRSRP